MAASFISEKAKAFMGKRGPPGYIPGVGRGYGRARTRSGPFLPMPLFRAPQSPLNCA